ncbi:restriction endonuclease subunit S [Listeria seeligeri]|uniref:restriction endonuclease subunit S n=1 Tax=Listeria seeligeri TaxID=1640 RepID=UPI0010D2EBF1|nr:restriction endonuclease subunit S [Listeria seeligeri]MBC1808980.1 restriction endonuclease subunit S [Listeria seeligeri]MBC2202456.1 restriction endonuclease subunit S [Listeria seeligeri]MBC2226236.1 restriction endonuclease subunit S [Listeria seeligeri]
MSDSKKKVPKRRFEEFSNANDWEQRKLDSIFKKIRNAFVGTATPYYVDSGHFYLESNNIKNGEINRNTEVFINDEFYNKQSNKLLHTDDIVMVQSGHVGHTAVIPEELDGTAAHALIMFTDYKDETNPYFLNYQFQTHKSKRKLDTITTGNTIKHILSSEMKEFIVECPSVEEQQKIGTFFKQLNSTIALHQRKLEKIKALKTAYLSEMYPAEGESKPKRRFAGFTDDWEQRKLGEVVQITMGQSPNGTNYTENPNDYILVQGNADMKNGQVVPRIWTKQITKTAAIGDIILSVRAPVGDVGKTNYNVVLGRGVAGIKGDEFIYQVLFKMRLENYWAKYSTGSTFESINSNDLKEAKVFVPKELEKKEIGIFFKQLDNTITLHQRKLKKLQNIKKAYLNEMFI